MDGIGWHWMALDGNGGEWMRMNDDLNGNE